MTPAREQKTKKRRGARAVILDVAERLFAEHGLNSVSLRTINTEAGYSVAALHYHFRTRDALIRALLERRVAPLLRSRSRLLDELTGDNEPDVYAIARALVLPMAQPIIENRVEGLYAVKFLFQVYRDPSFQLQVAYVVEHSHEVFGELLAKALPMLDRNILMERWTIATDLTFQGLAGVERLPEEHSPERLVTRLIEFIAGGLTSPVYDRGVDRLP